MTSGPDARRYLRRHRHGILSTLSQRYSAGICIFSRTPHVCSRPAAAAEVTGIDCDGCDIRADGEMLRIDFESAVTTAEAARAALMAMAKSSRTP